MFTWSLMDSESAKSSLVIWVLMVTLLLIMWVRTFPHRFLSTPSTPKEREREAHSNVNVIFGWMNMQVHHHIHVGLKICDLRSPSQLCYSPKSPSLSLSLMFSLSLFLMFSLSLSLFDVLSLSLSFWCSLSLSAWNEIVFAFSSFLLFVFYTHFILVQFFVHYMTKEGKKLLLKVSKHIHNIMFLTIGFSYPFFLNFCIFSSFLSFLDIFCHLFMKERSLSTRTS